MPLTLRRGRVSAIVEEHEEIVRLEVDGAPCVAYPLVTGPVAVGDDVVVNVQARELRLGSGGFDVLHANLTQGLELAVEDGAHVMKLPYTPLQFARVHDEESGVRAASLGGLPVVGCTLHSQVAPVCAALAGLRVAYVQVAGGALPLALSDTVRALRSRGLVHLTVSTGACFGGEVECVSVHAGLLVSKGREVDAVVVAVGPGIVGTSSRFGHGGLAAADALTATARLGGRGVLAVRVSEGDARQRHRGVSHHTHAVLDVADAEAAWPAGAPFDAPPGAVEVDVSGWREACEGLPLEHMGRGPDDDPWFFAAAYAAGTLART